MFYNTQVKKKAINDLKELGLNETEAEKLVNCWEEEAYILFMKKLERMEDYLNTKKGDKQ